MPVVQPWGTMESFLPVHLVNALRFGDPLRELPALDLFPAALLYSDISGFTTLTERLHKRGRRGAEEIAAIINILFDRIISIISSRRGSIVSFGGDSLFVLFTDTAPVHTAYAAAEEIQRYFAQHAKIDTHVGSVALTLTQAIHYGRVRGMHLQAGTRRHYLVSGPPVYALARQGERTPAGAISFSRGARKQHLAEKKGRKAPPLAPKVAGEAAPIQTEAGLDGILNRYIEPRICPLLGNFDGEYRQVTVIFFETKGSFLADHNRFFCTLIAGIESHDAVLLKSDISANGSKWLCVCGLPVAHEDDPERAVRIAHHVICNRPPRLLVRAGLVSGVVANLEVGNRIRRSFDIMGDAVNSAARVLHQAHWGEILVTAKLRSQATGAETGPPRRSRLRGKADQVTLYPLTGIKRTRKSPRLQAPLVGRHRELALLTDRLTFAQKGMGACIGIQGEAGVGKSRLVHALAQEAEKLGFTIQYGYALSFGSIPYWVCADLLRHALGISEKAPGDTVLSRVKQAATALGLQRTDRHHLAEILGRRFEDSPLEHLDDNTIHLNNMIALTEFFTAQAQTRPQLIIMEDMHWAGAVSREAFNWLAETCRKKRILIIATYRSHIHLPAGAQEINLFELAPQAVESMVQAILGAASAPLHTLIGQRSGGNPFFVEEVIHHLLESGIIRKEKHTYVLSRTVGVDDLPHTLESLICARLDNLTRDVKRVAQVGAVIGRRFLLDLLLQFEEIRQVTRKGIAELQKRTIIIPKQHEPYLEYIFKHALTRDVAYASILMIHRRKLHRAVAQAIETLFGVEQMTFLVMLAHHWLQGGNEAKARIYYRKAAYHSLQVYAHEEAQDFFSRYLQLSKQPDQTSVTARIDLAVRVLQVRGKSNAALKQLATALKNARALSLPALQIRCLYGRGNLFRITGQLQQAGRIINQALKIARCHGMKKQEITGLGHRASLAHDLGRYAEARRLAHQALALAQQEQDPRQEVTMLTFLALLSWEQGKVYEAQIVYEKSLKLARQQADLKMIANILMNQGLLYFTIDQDELARVKYLESLRIFTQIGDRRYDSMCLGNMASMDQHTGSIADSRRNYRKAYDLACQVNDKKLQATWLAKQAQLERQTMGDLSKARSMVLEALAIFTGIGEKYHQAHALCELGRIQLAEGKPVQEYLDQALGLARELNIEEQSDLGINIIVLRQAIEVFNKGERLLCGERSDNLPNAIRAWLIKNNKLPE